MRISRKCSVCLKIKTLDRRKWTKVRNVLPLLRISGDKYTYSTGTAPHNILGAGPEEYVCRPCKDDLLRRYPRVIPKKDIAIGSRKASRMFS